MIQIVYKATNDRVVGVSLYSKSKGGDFYV